jgi:ABC-2 type transport system ATP-binding protein
MDYNKAIEINGLVKVYKGGIQAVNNVSLNVSKNEIFGLVGPNGAGKSTIIKVLVTLIGFNSGKVSIFGLKRPSDDSKIRQLIGYVPQDISADGFLTGFENMLLSARLHGLHGQKMRNKIDETLKRFGILKAKNRLASTYSGGMIRKLELAQALIHTPKIVFLDEPTVGLDPTARDVIFEYVKELKKKLGITVVITTHYMDEADALCDRVAIMNHGKIIAIGTPKELKARIGRSAIVFETAGIKNFKAKNMKISGHTITIPSLNPEGDLPIYMKQLYSKGIKVRSARVKEITLDDVFIKFTGSTMQDEENAWASTKKTRMLTRRLG